MRRHLSALLLPALLVLGSATTLAAQVGYPPERSPYREIAKGHTVTPLVGHFGGSGGTFGVGLHDGTSYGLRYEVGLSSLVSIRFGAARAQLTRQIADPFQPVAKRFSGPVDNPATMGEVGLMFGLTGLKSWHGFAPYIGAVAGGAFSKHVAADTSGYNFGNKLFLEPSVGVRWFLGSRVHLRAESGLVLWKLNYPASFQKEPPDATGATSQAMIPIDGKLSGWTGSPWLQLGLGFSFRP